MWQTVRRINNEILGVKGLTMFFSHQEQSKLVWKIRDDLQKNCSLPELREMLEDNGLSSQGGESSVSWMYAHMSYINRPLLFSFVFKNFFFVASWQMCWWNDIWKTTTMWGMQRRSTCLQVCYKNTQIWFLSTLLLSMAIIASMLI